MSLQRLPYELVWHRSVRIRQVEPHNLQTQSALLSSLNSLPNHGGVLDAARNAWNASLLDWCIHVLVGQHIFNLDAMTEKDIFPSIFSNEMGLNWRRLCESLSFSYFSLIVYPAWLPCFLDEGVQQTQHIRASLIQKVRNSIGPWRRTIPSLINTPHFFNRWGCQAKHTGKERHHWNVTSHFFFFN